MTLRAEYAVFFWIKPLTLKVFKVNDQTQYCDLCTILKPGYVFSIYRASFLMRVLIEIALKICFSSGRVVIKLRFCQFVKKIL